MTTACYSRIAVGFPNFLPPRETIPGHDGVVPGLLLVAAEELVAGLGGT